MSVVFAGEANSIGQFRFADNVFAGNPLVIGEPQVNNQQNVVVTDLQVTPVDLSTAYIWGDLMVPVTGHFELTLTFTVTIDPAATARMEFRAMVLQGDQTLVEEFAYLPVNVPPTNTPEPTATGTVPETNTPELTATSTSVPETNTPEPTASNTPEATATSPVTALPETGHGQRGTPAPWALLAAAGFLFAATGLVARRARLHARGG